MLRLLTKQHSLSATSSTSSFAATEAPVDEEVESRIEHGQQVIDRDHNMTPLQKKKGLTYL